MGLPVALYGDGLNILVRNDPHWTPGRTTRRRPERPRTWAACSRPGHRLYPRPSPQAKGRIERLWATLQDRLASELRVRGVHTRAAANALLPPSSPTSIAASPIPRGGPQPSGAARPDDLVARPGLSLRGDRRRATTRSGWAAGSCHCPPGPRRPLLCRHRRGGARTARRPPPSPDRRHGPRDPARAVRRLHAHAPRGPPRRSAGEIRAGPHCPSPAFSAGAPRHPSPSVGLSPKSARRSRPSTSRSPAEPIHSASRPAQDPSRPGYIFT